MFSGGIEKQQRAVIFLKSIWKIQTNSQIISSPLYFPHYPHRRCSMMKNVLGNFSKFTGLRPATLLKKRLWHRCFPVNFCKIFETVFYRTLPGDFFWLHVSTYSKGNKRWNKHKEKYIFTSFKSLCWIENSCYFSMQS